MSFTSTQYKQMLRDVKNTIDYNDLILNMAKLGL
jgi:hypothetical protein